MTIFRLLCFCCWLALGAQPLLAQRSAATEAVLRKIADRILQSTPYQFMDTKTQQT